MADNIPNLEPGDHPVELITPELQVLFHPGDEGIVDVVTVEVFCEESKAAKRQYSEVELADELLLLLRRAWSCPKIEPFAGLSAEGYILSSGRRGSLDFDRHFLLTPQGQSSADRIHDIDGNELD